MSVARVTLQTIADQVGVSRMTVSNAFSKPDQLSPDLRQRILVAAEELGYSGPDPAARALARGATGTVGILLTDSLRYAFTDEVATDFLGAVADQLAPTGLALTLLTSTGRPSQLIPARDIAMDGALVFSCEPESEALRWLARRKLPMVFVDKEPWPDVPSVNVDDRGGARAAAQHVLDLGHRRIGLVTSNYHGDSGRMHPEDLGYVASQRMLGWQDALGPAGVEPQVVQVGKFDQGSQPYEETVRYVGELLDLAERPTAILAYSDVTAGFVVQAARQRGLRVPEDVSVAGFDDAPLARIAPGLTTVHQDSDAKGRTAAALLTEAIESAKTGARREVRHVVLPTELVVRGSTAPPPPG